MDEQKPNNPPVMPVVVDGAVYPGVSLRDHIAALALAGMLANPNYNGNESVAATAAYEYATAMLRAREGT